MFPLTWILLIPLAFAIYGVVTFNRFIALRQRLANAFSDIDVQLKRRWDLVPALVETVRGYAGHEKEVLTKVVAARGEAMNAPSGHDALPQRGDKEAGLAKALTNVFALSESYPPLKADQNFQQLHQTLVEIEDDLQNARRYYNAVVRDLNTLRQTFPSSLIGAATGIKTAEFFQLNADERAVPAIDLDPQSPPEES